MPASSCKAHQSRGCLSVEGFDSLVGRGVNYGAARSEAANTHGLDVHIVGAGNSAGQATMFFANHARSVTILCRGATLAKEEGSGMSRYLIDQLATRPNVHVLYRTEVVRALGANSLEAIDVKSSETGETTRLQSGASHGGEALDVCTGAVQRVDTITDCGKPGSACSWLDWNPAALNMRSYSANV